MTFAKTRRVLLIATANIVVVLAVLSLVEGICRYVEQVKSDRRTPAQLRKLPPKGRSELRVFAFGGSTVFGEPAPEVGFVAQMQHWLRSLYPDRDIRVYNFGWPAMDTAYVVQQLTRRIDAQPDLVIVITGHNEFFEPRDQVREVLTSHLATMRLLQGFFRKIQEPRRRDVMPCQVVPWDREAAYFKRRIANFEQGLNLIVTLTRQRNIRLILGTLPSNLSDWPPVYKKLSGRDRLYSDTVSRIRQLLRDGKYREASDAVTTGFSLYPEDAMLYFLRGKIQSATGNYTEARESFVKARDLDPFPYRATSQINSIIRAAAAGVAGVHLVDLERVYGERASNGLVGFDFMVDNCHGTPLGESVSAAAIIQSMTDSGFLPPARTVGDECCPLRAFLADVGYLEPKSPLRRRVLLSNATYVMKTPFLNYEASRMYLMEAMKEDENSWQVWANLATVSYFEGDNAAGARELSRATELRQAP
ncbi:MAG: hypothetical protein LAQ69_50410, partial [Acidobacteriia bacterium]|nr:hypothetical protein [Terriglobia bacterium]